MKRSCEAIVRWGLVALIAFTPLAFGTVESWSVAIMEWGILSLVVFALLGALWPETKARPRMRLTGLELPVALFVAYCGLQLAPFPSQWLRTLSPGAARLYAAESITDLSPVPVPATTAEKDPILNPASPATRPLTVSPEQTRSRLLLLVSMAAAFFLVARWASEATRVMFLLSSITITAFVVALFGLVQYLTWNGRIYWFRRVPSTSSFGPFVNHNHFAGYVGMVIPIALCFGFFFMESRKREDDHSAPDRLGRLGLALFASVLLVVSLFFSLSRGGILSTLIGGIVLFTLVSKRMVSRVATWSMAILLAVVAVVLIGWIGADIVRHQIGSYGTIEHEASFQSRVIIWRTMLEHGRDFLWLGSGLGTFEESFATYTPPGSAQRWDRAHNDYLQLGWETGLVGLAIFLVAAGVFVRKYWWPALRSRSHPLSLFRLGLAISVLTIALHSLVDFNLQIGSNGFLFAIISGSIVALHDRVEADGKDDAEALSQRSSGAPG